MLSGSVLPCLIVYILRLEEGKQCPKILPQVPLLGIHTPEALLLKPGLGFLCSLSIGPLSGSRMQLPKAAAPDSTQKTSCMERSSSLFTLSHPFSLLPTRSSHQSSSIASLTSKPRSMPSNLVTKKCAHQQGTPHRRLAAIKGWRRHASIWAQDALLGP